MAGKTFLEGLSGSIGFIITLVGIGVGIGRNESNNSASVDRDKASVSRDEVIVSRLDKVEDKLIEIELKVKDNQNSLDKYILIESERSKAKEAQSNNILESIQIQSEQMGEIYDKVLRTPVKKKRKLGGWVNELPLQSDEE